MVRLDGGRVESADMANIVAVMESIEQSNAPFSVIVFEVGKLQSMDLSMGTEAYKEVSAAMACTMYETPRIIFSLSLSEVANTKQKLNGLTRDMVNLIEKETPTVHIPLTSVKTISNRAFIGTRNLIHEQQTRVPTDELPEVHVDDFRLHKPEFESYEPAEVVHATLQRALKAHDADFTSHPKWSIAGSALSEAEQVFFSVCMYRLTTTRAIQVEFACNYLPQVYQLKFSVLVSRIHNLCLAIDKEIIGLQNQSSYLRKRNLPWTGLLSPKLHAGPYILDASELSQMVLTFNSSCWKSARTHVTIRLKDAYQYDANRRTLLAQFKHELTSVLKSLLNDTDQDVVRFAIYMVQNFAKDPAEFNELALPHLPETLERITELSKYSMTRKLANELY